MMMVLHLLFYKPINLTFDGRLLLAKIDIYQHGNQDIFACLKRVVFKKVFKDMHPSIYSNNLHR